MVNKRKGVMIYFLGGVHWLMPIIPATPKMEI
jgi:hypothetical protein